MYCQRTAKTCEGNEIASILMLPQQSFNSGIGKDKKLTAAKATLLCSLTSRTTPPLPSPPLPSHPPSTPYPTRSMIPPLITWPHRLEWGKNLKTPSVSLVRAWRKKQKGSILPLPLPSHLFSLSKPISSLSWYLTPNIPLGRKMKGVKNFWEKKAVLPVC